MLELEAITPEGARKTVRLDKFPDSCPLCHYAIDAVTQGLARLNDETRSRLEIVFLCPRLRCQSLFIARYYQGLHFSHHAYSESLPFKPLEFEWADPIKSISPNFCTIANEAQNAENQGWKLIAGPGYRKALEYLIKDYLCELKPAEAEKIKNVQLGTCIENYVGNNNIKQMAKRAAWLGNDETHYLRKWEDKDLEDLKKVLELTVHWISMEELTKSVVTDMPEDKS
jgi:hypothetical protein